MPDQNQLNVIPFLLPLLTAGLGILVGIILEKFKNRTVYLQYKMNVFRLAISAEHNVWGNIQVNYNGRETKHLSLITYEVKNNSNIDLEKVQVDFWIDRSSQMLAHRANYVETGNAVPLEEKYLQTYNETLNLYGEDTRRKEADPNHQTPVWLFDRGRSMLENKVFMLPVFNKNTSVMFQILAENFVGEVPQLSISILHKACKLIEAEEDEAVRKRRNKYVGWLWISLVAIFTFCVQVKVKGASGVVVWTAVSIFLLLYVALGIYYLARLIRRIWR